MSQASFVQALRGPSAFAVTPASRLSIYRDNVAAALTAALTVRYPVIQRLVGNAFFAAMAQAYGEAHPPASPRLIGHGDALPCFIAGFAPVRSVPYLADVARLECAWWRAYHAADETVAAPAAFAAIAAGRLGALRPAFHPAASIVASPWPVAAIWRAHKAGGDMRGIDLAEPETALVSRPALDVVIEAMAPGQARFLACLMADGALAEAAEAALAAFPDFDLASGLRHLVASGIVSRVGLEE